MINPINSENATKMVRVFCQDATGKIYKGDLIPEEASETLSQYVHNKRIQTATIPINLVARLKYVFLEPEATVKNAKKIFDKMA